MYGYKNKANSAFKSRNYTLVPRKAKNANRNPKNHNLHTQNVTFIVACQDRDWCKQNLRPEDNGIKFLAGNNPPEVDMLSLSMLDHVIISVGTYSWWVGFLNTGIVVHYKDFIVRGTKIGNGYGPNGSTEWMLPHWIPM
ncbi:hypothetical protein BaRGS_00040403 [Batillaria attramentaria]|uniref:L-Fucosyltransferase n=1 Tax=Batillaria attramentaria TaxID=370345 RepID=A0ABD0J087_9CAEN